MKLPIWLRDWLADHQSWVLVAAIVVATLIVVELAGMVLRAFA